jgi:hypothetical protein
LLVGKEFIASTESNWDLNGEHGASTEGIKNGKGMGERVLMHAGGVGLPTLNRL